MDLKKIKAVIFDMDGVIIDSEPLHYEAHKRAFETFGHTLSQEDYQNHIRSRGRHHGYPIILGPEVDVEKIAKVKDQVYRELISTSTVVFEDTLQLIDRLGKMEIPMAIGTSSADGRHIIAMLGLEKHFAHILTAQDVSSNKPNPEIYLTCMNLLKVEAEHVLIIEDSPSGIQAAVAAGARVIYLVRPGERADKMFLNHDKVRIVENLKDLVFSP